MQVLREFEGVGARCTSDLTDGTIARWVQAFPHRTPATLKSHLRCLSSLCTRARKKGYIRLDPFEVDGVSSWVAPTVDRRPRNAYGPSRPKRSVGCSLLPMPGPWAARGRPRDCAYVYTVFLTGARSGEIQRLEIADVDFVRLTITIQPKWIPVRGRPDRWWKPKTQGSSAEIPIGKMLSGVLWDWSRQCALRWLFPGKKLLGPWTSGGPGERPLDQVRQLGLDAGVPGLTNKAGRKGIGTHAKVMNLTTFERREYFRHEDDETGDFYDDEKVESMRPAAAKIEMFYLTA